MIWVRAGGFGMSHSGKGSSHWRLRWTGTLAVGVARGVVALVLGSWKRHEVSAGAESAKPQHGFSEGPTRSGEVHAVRDQVAAGAFDRR